MSVADAAWLSIYALAIGLCGTAIRKFLTRHDSQHERDAETAAMSLALGIGGLPWILLTLSMLGLRPMRYPMIAVGIASAVICRLRRRRAAHASTGWSLRACAMPAIALLLLQAVLLVGLSLSPTYEQDAVAIWGLKARVLYFQPLRPTPAYFLDLSLSFTHLDYPLLLPMLWAGTFAMLGRTDETISKLILLLPTLGIALLIYGFAVKRVGRSIALVLAALAIGSAATTRWAAQGVADQMLALFILAAAVSLVRYLEQRRMSDACQLGLFAAVAALTKLEGSILLGTIALIFLALLMLHSPRRPLLAGMLGIAVIYLPWLLWSWHLPHTHENYQARLGLPTLLEHLSRLPEVMRAVGSHLRMATWWPILLLPPASLVVSVRAILRPPIFCVWLILLTLLAADLCAYLVTPWPMDFLVVTTLERLLLQVTPLLMLLTTLQWQSLSATPRPSTRPPSLDPP